MSIKLAIGYFLGALAFGYALYAGYSIGETPVAATINVLLCVAGGVFGWITGILITPRDNERHDFAKVGGALMTFVTGFLLAKIEPLLDADLQPGGDPTGVLLGTLLFAVSFAVGALYVFVGRKYWQET